MNTSKVYPSGDITLRGRHISLECRFSGCSDKQPVVVVAGDEKKAKMWHEKIVIASKERKHVWLMDGEWCDSGVPMFFKFSAAKSKPRSRFDPEAEAEMGMGYY